MKEKLEMSLPSLADAILVIVLLFPGFISVTLFRRISILQKKISDYELVIWSIFVSLLIYLVFGLITGISGFDNLRDKILLPENLLVVLAFSLLFGLIPGFFVKRFFRRNVILGNCWTLTMKKASEKVSWIIIYTEDGLEYKGKLHYSGGEETPCDLTLREPKLIMRRKNGDVKREKRWGKRCFSTPKTYEESYFLKKFNVDNE